MDATPASTTFGIEISGMQPTITREIKFKNGDSISFSVTLDRDDEVKMLDLHKRSVQRCHRSSTSLDIWEIKD